jgi:uncharacterized protein YprB with RNaseH-like and TPR domain
MGLDLKRKLARLGAPSATAAASVQPSAEPESEVDRARRERIAKMRELIEAMQNKGRADLRAAGPRAAHAPIVLPGSTIDTPDGPLHRITQFLEPAHCHGKTAIARALEVRSEAAAALALDPTLAGIDLRRMLLLDTETTGLSGGTGTLPFLVGMAWFEDQSLHVEQLFLRRPGEERPLLARLAERIAAASCIVTYNGKSFDWPLLRTRAVMNRVAIPTPAAHLDLLHCTRRVFARRLSQVRLVQIETEVLGMRRERDVDGAEIPHLYWEFVRGAEASAICPVIEHNANDVIALAALLAVLGERWETPLPGHEPADRLGIARVALRYGDVERAAQFADAAARAGGSSDVVADALVVASDAERARERHDLAIALLREALDHAESDPRRAAIHLSLAKQLEHKARDFAAAIVHAAATAALEGARASARRVARLIGKRDRRLAQEARIRARDEKRAEREARKREREQKKREREQKKREREDAERARRSGRTGTLIARSESLVSV